MSDHARTTGVLNALYADEIAVLRSRGWADPTATHTGGGCTALSATLDGMTLTATDADDTLARGADDIDSHGWVVTIDYSESAESAIGEGNSLTDAIINALYDIPEDFE